MNYEEIKNKLYNIIMSKLDYSKDIEDNEVSGIINETVYENVNGYKLSVAEKKRIVKELFYSIRRLDILEELTEDNEVTEIMINGPNDIFIEKAGKLYKWDKHFESKEKLMDVIQRIVASCNRTVNEASPIVDARLNNGARVNVVLAPVAINGPIVTIRRFPDKPIQMNDLIRFGAISDEAVAFLQKLVIAGYNLIISGGTGSGKTTFLNALSGYIPHDERIVTIEDSAELQIQGVCNLVRLETRNANVEGCKEISIRELIKSSLRMRPDRLIVGEVRGAEAVDMIQAMNTGHDGSLSTGHANSAEDMLSRLETMILMGMDIPLDAIRGQIASGIDIIVHLGRLRDKSRKVLRITEILDYSENVIRTNVLYDFEENGEENGKIIGRLCKKNKLINTQKLKNAGIVYS